MADRFDRGNKRPGNIGYSRKDHTRAVLTIRPSPRDLGQLPHAPGFRVDLCNRASDPPVKVGHGSTRTRVHLDPLLVVHCVSARADLIVVVSVKQFGRPCPIPAFEGRSVFRVEPGHSFPLLGRRLALDARDADALFRGVGKFVGQKPSSRSRLGPVGAVGEKDVSPQGERQRIDRRRQSRCAGIGVNSDVAQIVAQPRADKCTGSVLGSDRRTLARNLLGHQPGHTFRRPAFHRRCDLTWLARRFHGELGWRARIRPLHCELQPGLLRSLLRGSNAGVFPEGEELLTSHFYRHYMVPMRWRHALSLCFWEEPSLDGLDCIFSMHRTEAQGDFSAAETRLLKSLHPLIDNARRRVDKLQIERSKLHSLEELIRDLPLAAAVLDWNLRPVYHNLAGRNECALWRQGENARAIKHDGNNFNVPDDLLQVCREMKREWSDISRLDAHSGRTMKREARNQMSLRALISLIPLNGSTFGKPSFLLQFVTLSKENAHPEPRTRNLSLLARLTREEREVAGLVCEGKSNDEIASSLSKSVWTVKRQMCSIFRKLDLKNRTELAMRLLTYSAKLSL